TDHGFPLADFFNSPGTGARAVPVAAHSTQRTSSTWNPGELFMAATSCPSTFSTTRPWPEPATHTTGSCLPGFFRSFARSGEAVARTTLSGDLTEFWYHSAS